MSKNKKNVLLSPLEKFLWKNVPYILNGGRNKHQVLGQEHHFYVKSSHVFLGNSTPYFLSITLLKALSLFQ